MVSTWSSGATLPSTQFQSMFSEEKSQSGLTFVDFLPEQRSRGGFFSQAKYETFRSLVDRANDWLRANPQWKIKTCESVEFKDKGNEIDSEKMIYLEYGEASTCYIRGLRLWISKRNSGEERSQQIGYINIVPEKKKDGGIFSSAVFEDLDEVIDRFNSMIKNQPIPGRIITIESQEMKTKQSSDFEPDKSSWIESGQMANHFLFVIRIFFELSDAEVEEIGIKDFIPDILERGGIFSLPKYELFSTMVNKASVWCSQQADIRICNAQSLEIKVRRGNEVDTQKMNYFEHSGRATFYVRILRLTYVKPPLYTKTDFKSSDISHISCKSFVPVQISSGIFFPEFETLNETKERISAWMKATGARVINCETTAMRLHGAGESKYGSEATCSCSQSERNQFWVYVIRLYINGPYVEPSAGMLPPVPVMQKKNCYIQ
ncbi:uncharacterized protein [Parasteatoda tepidariorum]|uniref:Uncharacterized protein n=1 Tax=Parasteatoda tepidariorum TaxID=114398 RepID=A0A2L2YCS2_PARTP|nr:uncharacterized protein LOC107437339 isoform X2 [Parasteatoda tepidariorum]